MTKLELTKQELDLILDGLYSQMEDRCCNLREREPYKMLAEKLYKMFEEEE